MCRNSDTISRNLSQQTGVCLLVCDHAIGKTPKMDGVISIKTKGEIFKAKMSSLNKYPDSTLTRALDIMSNYGLAGIPQDEDGNWLMDIPPDYFKAILDWLENNRIETPIPEGVFQAASTLGFMPNFVESIIAKHNGYYCLAFHNRQEYQVHSSTILKVKNTRLARALAGHDEMAFPISRLSNGKIIMHTDYNFTTMALKALKGGCPDDFFDSEYYEAAYFILHHLDLMNHISIKRDTMKGFHYTTDKRSSRMGGYRQFLR